MMNIKGKHILKKIYQVKNNDFNYDKYNELTNKVYVDKDNLLNYLKDLEDMTHLSIADTTKLKHQKKVEIDMIRKIRNRIEGDHPVH